MDILVLIVWTLAVARLTRLINADNVLDPPRLWVAGRAVLARSNANEADALGQAVRFLRLDKVANRWEKALYFVQCPWCVGMWLAIGTAWVPLWFGHNRAALYLLIALAASHLVGVCARFADTEEITIEDDDGQ